MKSKNEFRNEPEGSVPADGINNGLGGMLKKREFAARYGVCPRTCDAWIARGMPHLKFSARLIRIDARAADAWLAQTFGVRRRSDIRQGQ